MNTQLTEALEGIVAAHGAELEDVRVVNVGRRRVVRITVDGDGANGRGLSIDEIAVVANAISAGLDESNVMGEKPYQLEVASRGVGAPMTKPAHYRRAIGRLVKIVVDGESEPVRGRLTAADDDSVTVDIDGTERTLAFAAITSAATQVDMSRSEQEN